LNKWNLFLKNSIPTNVVAGYCDSQVAFKNNYPQLGEWTMDSLANRFGFQRHSHDALEDAILLKKLVQSALQGKKMKTFFKDCFDENTGR
jgi:DNA polymerase III epsilon subunit-like protein